MNRLSIVCALAGALACACGPGEDGGGLCEAALLPGDLVITEIFANPNGDDTDQEWFEIYNATSAEIELVGVRLIASREDGTSEKVHTMRSGTIAPGDYFVVGGVADADKPAHVDYGDGGALGALRNAAGKLAIRCDDDEIDAVVYADMDDGVAQGLDGGIAPDYQANDVAANWCAATVEFAADSFGTPGAANESCGGSPMGTCNDGGTPRDTVPPAAGDLVISEYMANPENVSDSAGEWFEIAVLADVDLNGVQLGAAAGDPKMTIASTDCIRVTAGTNLLFAKGTDAATNGGLPAVDFAFTGFSLSNSSGGIAVERGGTLLDAVTWNATVPTGKSESLDPGKLTPADNDDPANWCDGRGVFGSGTDEGTPGAANDPCLSGATCLDGGTPRATVSPVPGDLVITEFMANPIGSDTDGEWFEVLVVNAVDLNGLQLGQTFMSPSTTLADANCLHHDAGAYVLFARDADTAMNGGLPAVDYVIGFGLTNTTGSLAIELGGVLLDGVAWTSPVTEGKSESLDPDFTNPTDNDVEANWCDGVGVYGTAANEGTPKAANPQCP